MADVAHVEIEEIDQEEVYVALRGSGNLEADSPWARRPASRTTPAARCRSCRPRLWLDGFR